MYCGKEVKVRKDSELTKANKSGGILQPGKLTP